MKKILVIDDDDVVRSALMAALDYRDYVAAGAASGEEGIESAAADPPDLVFLDLKMRGWNGVETLVRLRALFPTLPVYIVTGFHEDFLSQLRELRDKGTAFDLARKPLTVAEIRAIADGVLAPSSMSAH